MKRDQCDFRGKVVLLHGGSSKIRQELHSCQCLGEGRGHVQILNKIFQHSGRKLCQNRSIWTNYPVRGEINSSRLAGASLAGIGRHSCLSICAWLDTVHLPADFERSNDKCHLSSALRLQHFEEPANLLKEISTREKKRILFL